MPSVVSGQGRTPAGSLGVAVGVTVAGSSVDVDVGEAVGIGVAGGGPLIRCRTPWRAIHQALSGLVAKDAGSAAIWVMVVCFRALDRMKQAWYTRLSCLRQTTNLAEKANL